MSHIGDREIESNIVTGGTTATVSGNLPRGTIATLGELNNSDATKLAQKHVSDIVSDDVLFAYDISLLSNNNKYQPEEHNQKVKVKLSNIKLDNKRNYAMLHIIDDNNYEILPITKLNNNEIEFEATRFSVYMVIAVGSNNLSFEGENYKIYDTDGNEITASSTIADTTNFTFKIVPNDGYGIIDVSCTTALGTTAVDGNGALLLTISDIENGKQGVLSSITEDLTIDVTTYEKATYGMNISYYNSKVLSEPNLKLPATITVGLGEIKTYDLDYNGDGTLSFAIEDDEYATVKIEGNTLTVVGVIMGSTTLTVDAAKGENYCAASASTTIEVVETTKAIETEWTIPAGGATINLPIPSATTNMYRVDWGDGTVESYTTEAFPDHEYTNTEETTYLIKVSGKLDTFGYTQGYAGEPTTSANTDYYSFAQYLTGLKRWGSVGATSYGFAWCTNLTGTIPVPNDDTFTNVTTMANLFYKCINLVGPIPEGLLDSATNVTAFTTAFAYCENLTGEIPEGLFDKTTQATQFYSMFLGCSRLTGEIPAGLFDYVTGATTFESVFSGCSGLTGAVPAGLFAKTPLVTTFKTAFSGCTGLTSVQPGVFAGNTAITSNTSTTAGYAQVFLNCSGLKEATVDSKYVGYKMFHGCNNLTKMEITDDVQGIYTPAGENGAFRYTGTDPEILETEIRTTNALATSYDWASDMRSVIDPTALVTEWTIPAGGATITLPIPKATTNAYTVDWGDGTSNTYDSTADLPTKTYTNTDETVYTISIKGKVDSFGYNGISMYSGSPYYTYTRYLTNLKQWGELGVTRYGFSYCKNLSGIIPSPTENSFTNLTSCECLFLYCSKLTGSIPEGIFANANNVTIFKYAFSYCSGLTGTIHEKLFANTEVVTDFSYAFSKCSGLTGEIPGNLFDNTPLVTNFNGTFSGCSELTGEIPENLFANTPLVTSFNGTFSGCLKLTGEISIELFANTPLVTDFANTFSLCRGLTGEIPSKLFEKNLLVTDFSYTFENCEGLTGNIPEELFKYTEKVETFSRVFYGCSGLTGNIPEKLFLNTPLVKDFGYTFEGCTSLTGEIPADLFTYTPLVSNFSYTFRNCYGLTGNIPAKLFAKTTQVTFFIETFDNCKGLTGAIPENLFENTPNVTSFNSTFANCNGITSIPAGLFDNNVGITSNTSKRSGYTNTFYDCDGLTSAVIDSKYIGYQMFWGCNNLTDITITDNVQAIYLPAGYNGAFAYHGSDPVILPTTLTTTNPVALSYDWAADNRGVSLDTSGFFTTEWTIPAGGATVTLPIPQADNNSYLVVWGDGTTTAVDNTVAFPTHTYTNTDETVYEIAITGTANSFGYFEASAPASGSEYYTFTQHLTGVKTWGSLNTTRYGFSNCTKLNSVSKDVTSTTFSNVTSMDYMFNNCTELTELNLTKWNTSTVTSMNSMFNGCTGLVRLDLSNFNTLLTTSMNSMFANSSSLKSILLGANFDKITGSGMFNGCTSLQSIITQRGNGGASITEIEVGDYIEYTPPEKSTTTTIAGQEVTLETEDAKWRVIEIDGTNEKILLAAEGVVNVGQITLDGIEGYMEGPDLLDEICAALYSDTELGVEARSMTVEDLNKICGYTVTESTNKVAYYPTGTSVSGTDANGYKKVAHSWGDAAFYTYDSGGTNATDSKGYAYRTPTSSNPVYVTSTYYTYNPVEKNSELEGILGTDFGWLASTCVNNYEDNVAYFGVYYLNETQLDAPGLHGSHGLGGALSYGLRPVISIDVSDLAVAMSEGDLAVTSEEETEIEVIADEPLEVGIKTLELATDTGLEDLTGATLYVPNLVSEEKYEAETNYETVFGAKDANGDIARVRPILEVAGSNPIDVFQNTVYDEAKDEGATIAGFDESESGEYLYYNYSLITSGLPVDTTLEREREVTYTTKYTDYTPTSGDAATIMTVMSATRTINVINADAYLITEWTIPVDGDGTIASDGMAKTTITLPIPKADTNAYTVNWGDGTSDTYDGTAEFPTHTYTNTEETVYMITIQGTVNTFGYNRAIEPTKTGTYSMYYSFTQYLTGLLGWGEIGATQYGFAYCTNLAGEIPEPKASSFANVTNFDYTFYNCINLGPSVSTEMFATATNATSYNSTFAGCAGLTSATIDLATVSSQMFYACNNLTEITIGDNTQTIELDAFQATSPYSSTNFLNTTLNSTNDVATGYDWTSDYRGIGFGGEVIYLYDATVTLNPTTFTYDGTAKEPEVTVEVDGTTLDKDTHYTVRYENNTEVGTATAIITGINNCIGEISENFYINDASGDYDDILVDLTAPEITDIKGTKTDVLTITSTITDPVIIDEITSEEVPSTGVNESATRYMITTTDTKPSADDAAWQASNVFAMPAEDVVYVWIKAEDNVGNVAIEGISVTIRIQISTLDITATPSEVEYDGTAKTLTITIEDGEKTLVENTDYTVGYTDNINAGDVTATITGQGDYAGSVTKTFKINPKSVEVVWGSETELAFTGAEQAPTATAESGVSGESITLKVEGKKAAIGTGYTATASIDTVTGGQGLAANYTLTNTTTTFSIKADQTALVTEWTIPVDADGTLATEGIAKTTITLPIPTATTNAYTVDWGDGKVETFDSTADFPTHTYENTEEKVYTIVVKGKVNEFGRYHYDQSVSSTNKYYTFTQYLTGLKQWGELGATRYGFAQCENLSGIIPSSTENSFVNVTSCERLFYECTKITELSAEMFLNATNVTTFESAFSGCSGLTSSIPEDLFANTPNVTSFEYTFSRSGISGSIPKELFFNTPEVTTFECTFISCKGLTGSIPEELFLKTEKVLSFSDTFRNCTSITGKIPANLFANTPNVTEFCHTFSGSGITEIPPELFSKTPNVTNFQGCFKDCIDITNIPAELFYNTPNAREFINVFSGSGITEIPPELFSKTTNADTFMYAFSGCKGLTSIPANLFKNTTKVYSYRFTFMNCTGITSIPAGLFATNEGITSNTSASSGYGQTFYGCSGLTSAVVDSKYVGYRMFYGCNNLKDITITDNVESIYGSGSFMATSPYSSTNLLATNLTTTNPVALSYDWLADNRAVDDTAPTATFTPNGNTTWSTSQSVTVTVADDGVGLNESSLKYIWTQSTTAPTEDDFTSNGTSFTNGAEITKNTDSGNDWYLWILAKDTIGNTLITNTNAFYLDNTKPNVTLDSNSITFTESVNITLEDAHSGVTGWQVTDTNSEPTEWNEITAIANTTVSYTPAAAKTYFVWAKDSVGNVSLVSEFTVSAKDIGAADVTTEIVLTPNTFVYDGSAKTPAVAVTVDTKTLASGKDYKVDYSNNIYVGDGLVTITGQGNYTGTKTATFAITNATLNVTLTGYNNTYDGLTHGVTLNGSDLEDATVTYSTDGVTYSEDEPTYKNVGTYPVYVKVEKANYNMFTDNTTIAITKKEINVSWGETSLIFNGSAQAPIVDDDNMIDGVNGEVINITVSGEQTNVGTGYTATASIGSVTDGEASNYELKNNTTPFEIVVDTGLAFTIIYTDGQDTFVYDGQEHKPAITVTAGGKTLIEGTDYDAVYTGYINAGTGKVTVTGKGNYLGTNGSKNFTITKRELFVGPDAGMSKVFGETDPAFTVGYDNEVSGETPAHEGTMSREKGENVGTYEYTKGTLALKDNGTFLADNYTLVFATDGVTFEIKAKPLSELTVSLTEATFEYDGEEQTPGANIVYNGTPLVDGTDYDIDYDKNIDAGTGKATITAKGNFIGTKELTFTINKKPIAVVWGNTELVYSRGVSQAPTATAPTGLAKETINLAITGAKENVGTDYTASIDLAATTVTGGQGKLDNYLLSDTSTQFDIVLPDGTTFDITFVDTTANGVYTYKGDAYNPEIKVTANGIELIKDTDYTVSYSNNIDAGTETIKPTITVTGINNYDGINGSKTFTINKKPITVVWGDKELEYVKGLSQAPTATAPTGIVGETINLVITGAKELVGTGYTAIVDLDATTVTGGRTNLNNYDLSDTSTTFDIVLPEGSGFVITFKDNVTNGVYTYDGTAKEPEIIVTTVSGIELTAGTDYTFDYSNNIDAGTDTVKPTITVTGINNYDGVNATKEFTINPKPVTVVWGDTELEYVKGLSQAPTATASTGVSGETINLAIIGEQIDVGNDYTATIDLAATTVTGGRTNLNNYDLSDTSTTFDIVLPEGSDFVITFKDTTTNGVYTYDGTAKEPEIIVTTVSGIELTAGTDYTVEHTNNIDAGTDTVKPTITVTGINNYDGINATKEFTINKKSVKVVWGDTELEYVKGLSQAPTATAPTGVNEETINLSITGAEVDVGTDYTAVVDLAATTVTGGRANLNNYDLSDTSTTFDIVLPDGSDFVIEFTDTTANGVYTYNGAEIRPEVKVTTSAGVELTAGTDYEVDYANNIDAGTVDSVPTITVTGINNYNGVNGTKEFTINQKPVTVVWGDTELEYVKGLSQAPVATAPTGVTGETINFVVTGAEVNVGTGYTAVVDLDATTVTGGQGKLTNYTLTNTSTTFDIVLPEGSDFVITFKDNVTNGVYTYDGTAKEPEIIVTTASGISLTAGTDYTFDYSNNIDAGTETTKPTIIVTGINNYDGVNATKEFTINQKPVTVVWGDTELEYVKDLSQAPTATVDSGVSGETINLSVTGAQINVGTGYIASIDLDATTVTGGRANLNNYSLSPVTTTFDIVLPEGSDFVITFKDTTTNGVYTYDGTAKEPEIIVTTVSGIELTAGTDYTFEYSNNIDAGTETTKPTIIVTGINNYNGINGTKEFTINKKEVTVVWGNTSLEFNNQPQKPTATATGVNGETINLVITGEQTNVGTNYTAMVDLDATTVTGGRANLDNYVLTPIDVTFEIIVPNLEFKPTLDNSEFDYDGDPKEPGVTVKVTIDGEDVTLQEGTDYEVRYEDNTEPGKGKVIITGKDNYEGIDTEVEFTINKIEREVSVIMDSYDYGGTLPTPSLSNNDEPGTTIFYVNTVDSVDGAFAWSTVTDNKYLDAGTYYMFATITETAHYKAKTTDMVTFEVREAIAVHPTVENKVYNGKTQVGVYGGQGIIITGVTEAIDADTYTAYGTLADNYKWADGDGEKEYVWTISPLNINNAQVSLDKYTFFYDGTAKEPNALVSLNGIVLEKDKDYTVTYENNTEIGTAKAIITGINNFEGSITKEFTIKELLLDRIELDNTEFTYIGDEIKPNERVYDTEGNVLMRDRDYTLYFINNIQVGTATIGAVGKGNYKGTVETTYEIIGNLLTNAKVTLSGFPFVYDGNEKRPDVEVVFEGLTLVRGRDYEVSYENNVDAGENTAIVTITGIGKYAGSIEKYFTIMKADRNTSIVPGKAILLGQIGNLYFEYDGETAETITVIVDDSTIASVADKEYSASDWLELTGLKVGKSTIKVIIAETNNYNEAVLNTEVTVFENEESAYPIYGTVVINDNDEFTISPRTLLTLNVDFGDYMYISESNVAPSADNPEWYEFSTKMPYIFDDVEGEKTIYVWFKDKNGNISEMATDSIILDYDADTEAKDSTMLDQTEIDKMAPDVETHEYHNDSVDVKVTFNQEDVMVNDVRSGVDHSTIKYGYKETGSSGDYIWQDSNIFTGLKYNTPYTFVTQASDRAGNGPTISDEKLMRTERKYNITITLEDKNAQYDGDVQHIDEAVYTLVNDTPITGTLVYTYYIDKDCTIVTTPARDGSEANGGAPRLPGSYYVKVTLTGDAVYYDTESNVANLRIGWEISKTEDDNVFAYLERVDENSDEFILHISGEGNMADLDELLANNNNNPDSYWTDYKDKITSLDIGNTSEDNITNIGSEMFSDLTKITDIVIPDTVISIGDYAFEGCTSVTEVIEIPVSVAGIGAGAFKDVNTPEFEVAFGSTTFDTIDGVLTDAEHKELIAYPNGKTDIKYEIPEGITTIKESAFSGADKLRDVVITNGVEVIEGKAFYECTNLEIVEIEDLMSGDNIIDLDSIGGKAFDSIAKDSVIYTFSEEVAKKFTAGTTHNGENTKVYWPPVITLDPIDMNGAIGYKVKFIIDTKAGNPAETKYQWYKVEGDTVTLIAGATSKEYITDSLTAADDNTYYYCIAYNDDYYFERGYVSSQRAKLTMLDSANYMVERGTYNTYLFETLQDAFNFAENSDVIKPLKTVDNEADAILSGNKSIMIDLNTNTINLTGKIEIDSGSKVELVGDGAITKSGGYIFENKGELILNGEFDLINNTGFGIKSLEDSKLTYTAGNITVDSNAIYTENATVNINGANANIVASTENANANAISLHGTTTFDMSAGNVSIGYKAEPTSGNISGIYVAGETSGAVNISGGTIKATATVCNADAIVNAGASDVRITGTANIVGTRSGVMTSNTNTYGDIYVQGGTITGGTFGILNNANGAKVVIGTEGKGVIVTSPVIVGEKVAIFNTKENNTLEMYDGILYSHGTNVIYEELNNTSLSISDTITEHIYSEEGRTEIKTENDYFLVAEENVSYNSSTYTAVHLEQYKAPTIGVDVKDQTVEVGEKATFEIVVSGGIPAVYEYQWQVSRDGGITWTNVTVGTGANTSKYTTPIATITMDGYKYRCLVTNGKKDIISRAAALTVVEKVEIGDLRPVVRFEFTNGRVVANEMIDGKETKVVNMQVIVKSFSELQTLVINGTNILGQKEYNFTDGSIRLTAYSPDGVDYGPIKITKVINDKEEIVEYTYTYNMKVLVNGVITAEVLDVQGRDNSATQIVDLLFDLKVDYYKTDVSKTNKNVTVVFFANKPVKPIKSITSSYINSKYLDLISVDKKEYSYRYTLELDGPLSETVFWFEDEFKNQAYVTVEEILRVEYKDIKFGKDTIAIDDLTVIDAFNIAQELETVTEVNSNEELQARYGLNSVQSDMFMGRARDLGALSILNNATVAKSYDGVFIDKIEATVGSKESVYDPVAETTNLYVAAAAKDRVENELTSKNRKYVDIITKDVSLYKGMNISDFVIDDKAPYMYTINDKVSNITSTTIAEAGFRATIIPK